MDVFYSSVGVLRYGAGWRLTVEVDQSISDYYRSLIPKYHYPSPPRWPAHITVVREEKEFPTNPEFWRKYDGEEISFLYSPIVQCGKVYFWLNALCKRLEEIRAELGLPITSMYTRPPEGFSKYFHMTIANSK